jgi:hypothetical protein
VILDALELSAHLARDMISVSIYFSEGLAGKLKLAVNTML